MSKILDKFKRKPKVKGEDSLARITNDTVAEYRKKVLSEGRRFKYPLQYSRNKLVVNTILISLAALVLAVAIVWWQLYLVQNSSTFFYRITRVVPVPVASVDGHFVRYSDYLMRYRSSVHFSETKEQVDFNSIEGKKQLEVIKEGSMRDAVVDAYAGKLAEEFNVNVSDEELESLLSYSRELSTGEGEVSQPRHDSAIMSYYGWNQDEYRYFMKRQLLRQKVAYEIDGKASQALESVRNTLSMPGGHDMAKIAEDAAGEYGIDISFGTSGWVAVGNRDGGLTSSAAQLDKGKISGAIRPVTGDGYYFVRLIDSNELEVSYEFIHIPLTVFDSQVEELFENDRVKEFISIDVKEEE